MAGPMRFQLIRKRLPTAFLRSSQPTMIAETSYGKSVINFLELYKKSILKRFFRDSLNPFCRLVGASDTDHQIRFRPCALRRSQSESRMRKLRMSGLMSGDGKRGFMLPRPSSTLLVDITDFLTVTYSFSNSRQICKANKKAGFGPALNLSFYNWKSSMMMHEPLFSPLPYILVPSKYI